MAQVQHQPGERVLHLLARSLLPGHRKQRRQRRSRLVRIRHQGNGGLQVRRGHSSSGFLRRGFVPGRLLSKGGCEVALAGGRRPIMIMALACTALAVLAACSSDGSAARPVLRPVLPAGATAVLGKGTLYLLLGNEAISANL